MDEQSQSVDTQKLEFISELLDKGQVVPEEDIAWLIRQLRETKEKLEQTIKTADTAKQLCVDQGKSLRAAKEVLTLWLALRGSSDLDLFQATQSLANKTVAVVNT